MKTSFKRAAAWLLTVLMILSCVPALATEITDSVTETTGAVQLSDDVATYAIDDSTKIKYVQESTYSGHWEVPVYFYNVQTNEVEASITINLARSYSYDSSHQLNVDDIGQNNDVVNKLSALNGEFVKGKVAENASDAGYSGTLTASFQGSYYRLRISNWTVAQSNQTPYSNYAVYVGYTPKVLTATVSNGGVLTFNGYDTTSYIDDDGDGSVTLTLPTEDQITANAGYRITGWKDNNDVVYAFGQTVTVTTSTTFSPVSTRVYTITYNQNVTGGKTTSVTVDAGSYLSFPALMEGWEIDGKTFAGWSTDSTGVTSEGKGSVFAPGVAWVSGSGAGMDVAINENVTFYAIWIDTNSTTTTKAYFHIRLDGMAPFEPSSYEKSGYTENHGMEGTIKTPVAVNNDNAAVAANIQQAPSTETILKKLQAKDTYSDLTVAQFEAQYKVVWYVIKHSLCGGSTAGDWHVDGIVIPIESYMVIYHANGGGNLPANHSAKENETVKVAFNEGMPSRAGYTFLGWSLTENPAVNDVSAVNYSKDGTTTFEMPAHDVDLYAVWKANNNTEYKVEYYYEGEDGSYPTTADSSVPRYGTTDSTVSVTDEDKVPQKYGYVLDDNAAGKLYSGTIAADGSLALKVYFKYTGGDKINIPVNKVWEGMTGDAVIVNLFCNDVPTGKSLTLDSSTDWKGSFTDLLTYDRNGVAYTYTITEDQVDGYATAIAGDKSGFTITNTQNTEDVTIKKIVAGNFGDQSRSFTFKAKVVDKDGAPVRVEGMPYGNDGYYTFSLKHNETKKLANLPIGATLCFHEENDGNYTQTVVQGVDSILLNGSDYCVAISSQMADITVTNTKDGVPDTGVVLDSLPYIVILAIVVVGVVLMLRKRRRDDD